jgi:hypothetical protein
MPGMEAPLVIEFVDGSSLEHDALVATGLPVVGNGPPGTRVVFPDGHRINLPTDQIVSERIEHGRARVSFGGMRWVPDQGDVLVFDRVKDLWPAARLSPERGNRMTLDPVRVHGVWQEGVALYPRGNGQTSRE